MITLLKLTVEIKAGMAVTIWRYCYWIHTLMSMASRLGCNHMLNPPAVFINLRRPPI